MKPNPSYGQLRDHFRTLITYLAFEALRLISNECVYSSDEIGDSVCLRQIVEDSDPIAAWFQELAGSCDIHDNIRVTGSHIPRIEYRRINSAETPSIYSKRFRSKYRALTSPPKSAAVASRSFR